MFCGTKYHSKPFYGFAIIKTLVLPEQRKELCLLPGDNATIMLPFHGARIKAKHNMARVLLAPVTI